MGSGASGVAALKYGCFYIGLDVSKGYPKEAAQQIAQQIDESGHGSAA